MRPAADGSLISKQLGMRLVPEGEILRLIDLATGQPILTPTEQAERERQRAESLEAEVRRLQALLHRRDREEE